MKLINVSIALLFLLLLSSCTTTLYKLNSDCSKYNKEEIISSISSLMVDIEFTIEHSDPRMGVLQAKSEEEYSMIFDETHQKSWKFKVTDDGQIVAQAKIIKTKKNAFGNTKDQNTVYMGDHAMSNDLWYWKVRRGLEELCGTQVIITEENIPMQM